MVAIFVFVGEAPGFGGGVSFGWGETGRINGDGDDKSRSVSPSTSFVLWEIGEGGFKIDGVDEALGVGLGDLAGVGLGVGVGVGEGEGVGDGEIAGLFEDPLVADVRVACAPVPSGDRPIVISAPGSLVY